MQQSAGDWLKNNLTMLQQVSCDIKQLSTGWLQQIWQEVMDTTRSHITLYWQEWICLDAPPVAAVLPLELHHGEEALVADVDYGQQ